MKLKVSCRFIDNLQTTNSNVKLLRCYGIFLTSLNLTEHCDDPAHQRMIQETLHTLNARWGRDTGITSLYAKAQDCSTFHSHANEAS